jgi:hypothetical protein
MSWWSDLELSPYKRWSYRTSATQVTVGITILCSFTASIIEDCFQSEDCTSAIDSRFLAPHLQSALAMAAAVLFASLHIFTVGGGIDTLRHAARDHEWQLALISLSLVSSHLLFNNAISVMSGTATAYTYSWIPLVMPFAALCFEREPNGEVLNYRSGVLTGLLIVMVGTSLSVSRHGATTSGIGLACAIGSLLCECLGYVTTSVVLRANGMKDGGSGASGTFSAFMPVAWWGALGALPVLVIKSSLVGLGNEEYDNLQSLFREHLFVGVVGFCVYSCASGFGILLKFALVHSASPLTTALVQVCALSVAAILSFAVAKVPTFAKQLPLNIFGLCVLAAGVIVHIRYMRAWQRQREHEQLSGHSMGGPVLYGSPRCGSPNAKRAGPVAAVGAVGVAGIDAEAGSLPASPQRPPPTESTPLNAA